MVGCGKSLAGIHSTWIHRGKIASEYEDTFWNSEFCHSDTKRPIACGDSNHTYRYAQGTWGTCCRPEENPILCDDCLRRYGYIW